MSSQDDPKYSYSIQMAEVKKDVQFIKETQLDQDKKLDKIMMMVEKQSERLDKHQEDERKYIDERFKDTESKFAPAWVRDLAIGVIAIIGSWLIILLFNSVLK